MLLDDLLVALADLDAEELREANREGDLDLTELCDTSTPTGLVFRFLCVLCDQYDFEERVKNLR